LAVSAAGSAYGQDGTPAGGFQSYVEGPDLQVPAEESSEYITFDFKDRDLREVLKFISVRVGVNIVADSNVRERVTQTFDRVEWRNALEIIAEQTNSKIIEVSSRLIRFTQPPTISMEFRDAEIGVVLDLLAKQAGANIVMSSDIRGKVSLSLRDVPWREALETLVKTAGFITVRDSNATSEILRVVRPESLKEQLVTRHFTLRYVRPEEPYTPKIDGIDNLAVSRHPQAARGGEEGGARTGAAAGGGEAAGTTAKFSLADALSQVVSKEGTLQYDVHTNTFIVKDIKPKLDEIEQIIRLVDVPPPQVYVEVKFIRTTSSDILERGLKFDLEATPERDGFQVIARGAQPGEIAAFAADPLALFGGTFPFDIGRVDRPPFGLRDFQALGILDFTQTRILLKLVKDDENSRIVQEPSLTVVDNRPAVIFVGESVPFAVQNVRQDQNGNVTVAIEENERSPINIGFTLYLVPHVIAGTDTIDLSVIPRVSALSGTTSQIAGFERFAFSPPGSQTAFSLDLPREAAQTVITYLRVGDGQTAVIGGLQTERRMEIETKIPLLSSIPVLGNIFTWRRKQANVESLLILITPHILKSSGQGRQIFDNAIRKHQKADYFFNKYEKPKEVDGDGSEAAEPEGE
jgi:type IV pilus assembly protein PilQ